MRSIKRGFRNFYRHPLRNLVVVLLLFICLTFSLSMLAVKLAADSQIDQVKQSVGNYGEIKVSSDYQMTVFEDQRNMTQAERQAAARTMTAEEQAAQRTRFLIPEATADTLAADPAVVTYDKVLSQQIQLNDITSAAMQSMLSLRNEERGGMGGPSISSTSFTFDGNTNGASTADFLTGSKVLTAGSFYTYRDYLDANPVVMIEENLASENDLAVGDTITAVISGKTGKAAEVDLTIVGIYQTVQTEEQSQGNEFSSFNPAGGTFYAPLSLVQQLSATSGYVELGSYYFDNVDSTDQMTAAFTTDTNSDTKYTFATDYSDFQTIADPLRKTAKTSVIGLIGALGACALIIVLAMSIIVGGRTRELGVLKAIGATDRQVIAQFAMEVVCICLVAVIVATGVTAIISQKMGNWLMGNGQTAQTTTTQVATTSGAQGGPPGMASGPFGSSNTLYKEGSSATSTATPATDLNVVYRGSLLLYGILILFLISLLGMAVPIIWIIRLRPAQVLSME